MTTKNRTILRYVRHVYIRKSCDVSSNSISWGGITFGNVFLMLPHIITYLDFYSNFSVNGRKKKVFLKPFSKHFVLVHCDGFNAFFSLFRSRIMAATFLFYMRNVIKWDMNQNRECFIFGSFCLCTLFKNAFPPPYEKCLFLRDEVLGLLGLVGKGGIKSWWRCVLVNVF